MFSGKVKAELPGQLREKNIWIGEGTQIDPSVHIRGPVVLGRNCRIKKRVSISELSCIGDNSIIEDEAALTRSIVWDNVYVGRRSRINEGCICSQGTLNANVVVSEGAILGEKSHVGQGAVIHPGVKLWPRKSVDAGATVSLSLIWGSRWPGSLFGFSGISGLANIEVTPDFALKLGAAFGAFLEKNAVVCTSRDAHPASRMLNRAVICGLVSVGVNVYDLRVTPLPLARYAIRNQGARGGIHARIAPNDSRSILIEFLDARGINIDKATERKIENIFFREDFRLTPMDEVGLIEFPARALEQYNEGFFNALNKDLLKAAKFKIVIDYSYGNASLILPHILGKLGCETVTLNAYLDAMKARQVFEERFKSLRQLAHIVTTLDAHLGILMDLDAEKFELIDERGQIISGNRLLTLLAAMVLRHSGGGVVAAPVTAPSALEKISASLGAKIIRTKTDSRSLMHTAALGARRIVLAGDNSGGFIFPQFQPAFDAIFALAKILELMAVEKRPLSSIVDEIPPFFQAEASVRCEGEQKGRIMRRLIEENRERDVEMIDGLKIFLEDAWILILPNPVEPSLHLVSEAPTRDGAASILEEYLNHIEELKKQEESCGSIAFESWAESGVRPRRRGAKTIKAAKTSVPDDKAFHFWAPGRCLGIKVTTLQQFIDTIHYVEYDSLEFHMERGDFANWIEHELSNEELAGRTRDLQRKSLKAEKLREAILELFRKS
jgi:mannose-1-phosphate guanylyltransferase/phosphomannomutase